MVYKSTKKWHCLYKMLDNATIRGQVRNKIMWTGGKPKELDKCKSDWEGAY